MLEYHRSGGIRGLDDRLVVQKDGTATLTRNGKKTTFTIDAGVMSRLRGRLDGLEFGQLSGGDAPSRGADMYQYSITYQGHTVRAPETALPRPLHPIVELLDHVLDRTG